MIRKQGFASACACLLLTVAFNATAQADVIKVRDQRPMIGVKIIELNNGRVYYRVHTGRVTSQPIKRIAYLQILGWDTFNRAEKKQRDDKFRQAIEAYRKAIKELGSGAGWRKLESSRNNRHLDRRLLAKCRLVDVLDRDGQFDQAVKAYLDIIVVMPACLESLRPTNIPNEGSELLEPAKEMVINAIEQHRKDQIGVSLARWLRQWPGNEDLKLSFPEDDSKKADEKKQSSEGPDESEEKQATAKTRSRDKKTPRVVPGKVDELIEKGQHEEALRRIAILMEKQDQTSSGPAELFYWKGRTLTSKSRRADELEVAKKARRRAGLAFMRVVIHFPAHGLAPECLYRAGLLCQQSEKTNKAEQLWSELIRRYPEAAPWSQRAGLRLAEMRTASSGDS